jgi:hypothetical protein
MPRRRAPYLLIWTLLWALCLPGPAAAGWLLGPPRGNRRARPPGYQPVPAAATFAPPGCGRPGVSAPGGDSWQGYMRGVTSYDWGYFGAQPGPMCVRHRGYYGDYTQWSWRPGY